MEKIQKPLKKSYGPVVLYLDDLSEIVSILNESSENVEIKNEDFKFANVEEISKKYEGNSITNFRILADKPTTYLSLHSLSCDLEINDDTINSNGIFHKIDIVLNKRNRILKPLYSIPFFIISTLLLIIASNVTLAIPTYILIPLWILEVLWMAWIIYIRMKRHSIVKTFFRKEKIGFLKRNKDTLWIVLISGIIGAIFGAIVTVITNIIIK